MPKTIDNDILLMDKTFGFDTAVEEAQRAINSAYIEVTVFYTCFHELYVMICTFYFDCFIGKVQLLSFMVYFKFSNLLQFLIGA